jgi:hypothetical protein
MEENTIQNGNKNNSGADASYVAKGREEKKSLIERLIYKYVDWERTWYAPKIKFSKGDVVKPNWKAKSRFGKEWLKKWDIMIVESVDKDGVAKMINGSLYNTYWLKKG